MSRDTWILAPPAVLFFTAVVAVGWCSQAHYAGGPTIMLGEADSVTVADPGLSPSVLSDPHAILVLDVSGSMQGSDSALAQAEASQLFFTVLRDLGPEVLETGDLAKLAVVLYSTSAWLVTWDASGTPWLPVTDESYARFMEAIHNHLGVERNDRRTGHRTDHLAALVQVKSLSEHLTSPPLVVFMTDGVSEPHPLFSEAIMRPERERLLQEQFPEVARILDTPPRVRWDQSGYLIDTRALGVREMIPTPEEVVAYEGLLREERLGFERTRFPFAGTIEACPLWIPVLLRPDELESEAILDQTLARSSECPFWKIDEGLFPVSQADQLASVFISTLGAWFNLAEVQLEPSSPWIDIPQGTHAFALVLTLAQPTASLTLAQGTRAEDLRGTRATWAGVIRGSGRWSLTSAAPAVVSGKLLLRSRYAWMLSSPRSVLASNNTESPAVRLLLYSFEEKRAVDPSVVYSSLPSGLNGSVMVGPESRDARFRPFAEGDRGAAGFELSLPPLEGTEGTVRVEVDLAPLRGGPVPLREDQLSAEIAVRPVFLVTVEDSDGRPVRIGFDKELISDPARVRRWFFRLLEGW